MAPRVPLRVTIVGIPESVHSTVAGLADVFGVFPLLAALPGMPAEPPFEVTIAESACSRSAGQRLAFRTQSALHEIEQTDIVIVPALHVSPTDWVPDVHPDVVDWLLAMHARGATICSTCSGALLLAETGLLNGHEATTHWAYAATFRRHFPQVRLRLEHLMVTAGARREILMTGASGSWHDLALYLIDRHVGAAAAQGVARFLLLEWHHDGQAPFMMFLPDRDHGDAAVRTAQDWLAAHLDAPCPVDAMIRHTGMAPRTLKRRFVHVTGLSPIKYVQQLRIETAKRRLEQSTDSIDEIAWAVGYDDAAFFRRLFKRTTGITPGAYRRKLRAPLWHEAAEPDR